MNIRKIVYIVVGCIGLALGAIGAVVPLLPSFSFLLLATICFGKSSDRLHTWFLGTKLYKENLEGYLQGRGMTKRAKLRLMLIVTLTMSVGFIMLSKLPVGRVILVVVWVFHMFYFWFGIKTKLDTQDVLEEMKSEETKELTETTSADS